MIYDCFMFLNEGEVLEIRLNELSDVVDRFIIVEGRQRFNGMDKPLFFEQFREVWEPFEHMLEYHPVQLTHVPGPNKFPENKWREVNQRNHMKTILEGKGLSDDDIIILSDVDEIPPATGLELVTGDGPYVFDHKCYYYFLDNEYRVRGDNTDWLGAQAMSWRYLKDRTPENIRRAKNKRVGYEILKGGWHFSYMGGVDRIKYFLNSWAVDGRYGDVSILEGIAENVEKNRDLFGRDFIILTPCEIDDTYPEYLLENLDKFRGIIR